MAIITDSLHSTGNDYLLKMLGEKVFFRKADLIIENRLYRYRPNIERAAEEIKTGNIYLSDMSKQNDPFDSSYGLSDESFLSEKHSIDYLILGASYGFSESIDSLKSMWNERTHIPSDELISVEEFLQQFSQITKKPKPLIQIYLKRALTYSGRRHETQYKIACFSEENSSIPMWAYYANNHQGVCLEYDTSKLNIEDEYEFELKRAFCKVHYSDYRPQDQHGEYSLIVKSSQWSHEHEWRLICDTENNYISVPCLTAVYLGINFDFMKNGEQIIDAIRSTGKNIKLFDCRPDSEKYEIQHTNIII